MSFTAPSDAADVLILRSHLGIYGAWSFAGSGRSSGVVHPARRARWEQEAGSSERTAVEYDDARLVVPAAPVGAVRARLVGGATGGRPARPGVVHTVKLRGSCGRRVQVESGPAGPPMRT